MPEKPEEKSMSYLQGRIVQTSKVLDKVYETKKEETDAKLNAVLHNQITIMFHLQEIMRKMPVCSGQ